MKLRTIYLLSGLFAAALGISGAALAAAAAGLSPDQAAAVTRAESYLNDIRSMKARFVQSSSSGDFAEGEVLIVRPGRLRFEYDPPHPALLIADGVTLLYYDRELKEATYLPLWETPLWFLVRDEVSLTENLEITEVIEEAGVLTITVVDPENVDAGRVTLTFSGTPITLRKWEIMDAQGVITQVSLIDPEFDVAIDDELFNSGLVKLEGRGAPLGPRRKN